MAFELSWAISKLLRETSGYFLVGNNGLNWAIGFLKVGNWVILFNSDGLKNMLRLTLKLLKSYFSFLFWFDWVKYSKSFHINLLIINQRFLPRYFGDYFTVHEFIEFIHWVLSCLQILRRIQISLHGIFLYIAVFTNARLGEFIIWIMMNFIICCFIVICFQLKRILLIEI